MAGRQGTHTSTGASLPAAVPNVITITRDGNRNWRRLRDILAKSWPEIEYDDMELLDWVQYSKLDTGATWVFKMLNSGLAFTDKNKAVQYLKTQRQQRFAAVGTTAAAPSARPGVGNAANLSARAPSGGSRHMPAQTVRPGSFASVGAAARGPRLLAQENLPRQKKLCTGLAPAGLSSSTAGSNRPAGTAAPAPGQEALKALGLYNYTLPAARAVPAKPKQLAAAAGAQRLQSRPAGAKRPYLQQVEPDISMASMHAQAGATVLQAAGALCRCFPFSKRQHFSPQQTPCPESPDAGAEQHLGQRTSRALQSNAECDAGTAYQYGSLEQPLPKQHKRGREGVDEARNVLPRMASAAGGSSTEDPAGLKPPSLHINVKRVAGEGLGLMDRLLVYGTDVMSWLVETGAEDLPESGEGLVEFMTSGPDPALQLSGIPDAYRKELMNILPTSYDALVRGCVAAKRDADAAQEQQQQQQQLGPNNSQQACKPMGPAAGGAEAHERPLLQHGSSTATGASGTSAGTVLHHSPDVMDQAMVPGASAKPPRLTHKAVLPRSGSLRPAGSHTSPQQQRQQEPAMNSTPQQQSRLARATGPGAATPLPGTARPAAGDVSGAAAGAVTGAVGEGSDRDSCSDKELPAATDQQQQQSEGDTALTGLKQALPDQAITSRPEKQDSTVSSLLMGLPAAAAETGTTAEGAACRAHAVCHAVVKANGMVGDVAARAIEAGSGTMNLTCAGQDPHSAGPVLPAGAPESSSAAAAAGATDAFDAGTVLTLSHCWANDSPHAAAVSPRHSEVGDVSGAVLAAAVDPPAVHPAEAAQHVGIAADTAVATPAPAAVVGAPGTAAMAGADARAHLPIDEWAAVVAATRAEADKLRAQLLQAQQERDVAVLMLARMHKHMQSESHVLGFVNLCHGMDSLGEQAAGAGGE